MPYPIELGHLRDGRLKLLAPISVSIARADDGISAYSQELNEYGFGDDFQEAVADLQRAIAELYFSLKEERDKLGADLRRTWEKLNPLVEERR